MPNEIFFNVRTPLSVEVRTSYQYWNYIITRKHPTMAGKENIVKETLEFPYEIRQSKIDKEVYLYYRQFDKLYCVVAKQTGDECFLITAYPTDKIKEGDIIWTK